MSISNDIRGALVTNLKAVSGIPAIADEGVPYVPVSGTPFVDYQVVHSSGRPNTMGSSHLIYHSGLFIVTLVYPAKGGLGPAETMADTVKEAFNVATALTQNTNAVRIRFAERVRRQIESDWVRCPVSIGWYLYSQSY